MTNEPSPRPWQTSGRFDIVDANGMFLFSCYSYLSKTEAEDKANAALIVAAVNERDDLVENLKTANENRERENAEWVKFSTELKDERDRLRDIVRRFLDLFTHGTTHPAGTMARLLNEASSAIGEGQP